MTTGSPTRVAVLGCGAWGRNHVRTWAELGHLVLACDVDTTRRAAIEREYPHLEVAADPAAVLARSDLDAVVIATPAPTHAALTMAALDAGLDVLVEKPMTTTLADAEALVRRARESDRVVMVGHLLEYHPAVECLAEMVAGGKLGSMQYVASHRLNFGTVRTVENVLWSFAPHDVSVLLRLAGPPTDVACQGAGYVTAEVAGVAMLTLGFASEVRGHIFTSWLHPFKEHKMVVVGDEGMAVFDDTQPWESKLVVYPHRVDWRRDQPVAVRGEGEPVPLTPEPPLRRECEHFLARIADRAVPRSDAAAGRAVLEVLEAGDRSLHKGGECVVLRGRT